MTPSRRRRGVKLIEMQAKTDDERSGQQAQNEADGKPRKHQADMMENVDIQAAQQKAQLARQVRSPA